MSTEQNHYSGRLMTSKAKNISCRKVGPSPTTRLGKIERCAAFASGERRNLFRIFSRQFYARRPVVALPPSVTFRLRT